MKPLEEVPHVEFEEGGISVDADLIAEGLGLEPSTVQLRMRERTITSLCERGIDQDVGLYRLTFFYLSRRLSLIVDSEGKVRRRSLLNFGDRPLPVSAHRLG